MTKKKISGLRKAIRAVFRPREKQVGNVAATEGRVLPPEVTPARLVCPGGQEKTKKPEAADSAAFASPLSSSASSSSPSSSPPVESEDNGDPGPTLFSPIGKTSRPSKPPPLDKSFHSYDGHPYYHGARLYKCSDLTPEMDILGQWVELGSGQTATTRLVHILPEDGKLAAAKVIRGDNPEARLRKELDAFHVAARDHPSFPQLIGVVDQSPLRCILQEFVGNDFIPENITLEDVLSDKKMSSSEISHGDWLQIARDIAEGVLCLHQQGYIHSNIRPENILLYATDGSRKGFRAKLCDLGDCTFAKLSPSIGATPDIKAAAEGDSKPFVAPEVLSGKTPFTMSADVFALGRVFRTLGKKTKINLLKHIGKKCARHTVHKRPSMDVVCKMLSLTSK